LWHEAQSVLYFECGPDSIRNALSGWTPPVAGVQADVVWQFSHVVGKSECPEYGLLS